MMLKLLYQLIINFLLFTEIIDLQEEDKHHPLYNLMNNSLHLMDSVEIDMIKLDFLTEIFVLPDDIIYSLNYGL